MKENALNVSCQECIPPGYLLQKKIQDQEGGSAGAALDYTKLVSTLKVSKIPKRGKYIYK